MHRFCRIAAGDFESDWDRNVMVCVEDDEPCYIFYRLDEKAKWVKFYLLYEIQPILVNSWDTNVFIVFCSVWLELQIYNFAAILATNWWVKLQDDATESLTNFTKHILWKCGTHSSCLPVISLFCAITIQQYFIVHT